MSEQNWYQDVLFSDTEVKFSLWDRVRILSGCNFLCRTATLCENKVGKSQHSPNLSTITVLRHPLILRFSRKQGLYAEQPKQVQP